MVPQGNQTIQHPGIHGVNYLGHAKAFLIQVAEVPQKPVQIGAGIAELRSLLRRSPLTEGLTGGS